VAVGEVEDVAMSYHCGIGPAMAAVLGMLPCEPHIKCDSCGVEKRIQARGAGGNIAPAWLLDNKAPSGWKLYRHEDGEMRADYCPKCKVAR
jgi:hypothetical protein